MKDSEINNKVEKQWNTLSHVEKLNLLAENRFWDGFSVYKYEYIPEDLKEILWRRIKENEPKNE